jgi:hypothetical protein
VAQSTRCGIQPTASEWPNARDSAPAESGARDFSTDGYQVFRGLLAGPTLAFLHEYVIRNARLGMLEEGDPDVPGTPCRYGDPIMDSVLEEFIPRFESATGKRLYPTYSYFRVYKRGDVLKRHTDRPACEISVTLNLGYSGEATWPIWIERDDIRRSILLEPGDSLLYKGAETAHWREAFQGEYAAQVFLHYVDQNGPFREHAYDGRAGLAATAATRQMVSGLGSLQPSPATEQA